MPGADQRRYRRAPVGPEHRINLKAGAWELSGMPLNTLGAGGCGVVVPARMASSLPNSRLMDEVELDHEGLPHTRIRARVAFLMGKDPITLGLEFLEVPPAMTEALEAHVAELLGDLRPSTGY